MFSAVFQVGSDNPGLGQATDTVLRTQCLGVTEFVRIIIKGILTNFRYRTTVRLSHCLISYRVSSLSGPVVLMSLSRNNDVLRSQIGMGQMSARKTQVFFW